MTTRTPAVHLSAKQIAAVLRVVAERQYWLGAVSNEPGREDSAREQAFSAINETLDRLADAFEEYAASGGGMMTAEMLDSKKRRRR